MTEDLERRTRAARDALEGRLRHRLDELVDDETYLVEVPQDDDEPGEAEDSGSSNYFVDLSRDDTFDLAWMTTYALRAVELVCTAIDPAHDDLEPRFRATSALEQDDE